MGIEFTEVARAAGAARFYADLIGLERAGKVRKELPQRVVLPLPKPGHEVEREIITLPEVPGVASFFVPGSSLNLPPAMITVRRTRGPLR